MQKRLFRTWKYSKKATKINNNISSPWELGITGVQYPEHRIHGYLTCPPHTPSTVISWSITPWTSASSPSWTTDSLGSIMGQKFKLFVARNKSCLLFLGALGMLEQVLAARLFSGASFITFASSYNVSVFIDLIDGVKSLAFPGLVDDRGFLLYMICGNIHST